MEKTYKSIILMLQVFIFVFIVSACGDDEDAKDNTEIKGEYDTLQEENDSADRNDNANGKEDDGGDDNASGEEDEGNQDAGLLKDRYVLKNEKSVDIGEPDTKLDPQEVYSKLTYTPEMFYGEYCIRNKYEVIEKFGEESEYFTLTIDEKEMELTELPFEIVAGKHSMSHSIQYIEGYNWMRLYYMRRYDDNNCSLDYIYCAYTIEGNKLILKPLDTFEVDSENNKITYAFSDVTLEYTFSFSGRYLTLSTGDSSVTLTTGLDVYGNTDYFNVDGYLSPDSKSIDGIDEIQFLYYAEDGEDDDPYIHFKVVGEKYGKYGENSYNSIAVLQENGLFTFTLALEDSIKTYQFVYFYCNNDGIVLTDGESVYYYNDTFRERSKNIINDYITEEQTGKLEEFTDTQLEAIVEKKENLMEDLAKAFNEAGIKVTVDEENGELAMDSSVLFGGDSSALTNEGKALLNKFVDVYTSIVFSEKYEGFVSKTIVEGHTAPVSGSTYESGLPLSEERADNVKAYCISSETGIDTSKLAENLEAIGYSNSNPIMDADGNVDMAASRRVSFRFIINLEQQ